MAHLFSACSNCGAPTEPSPDGRSIECRYCGAHERVAVDPARIAASITADVQALGTFLEHMAGTLERGFPEHTIVQRSGGMFQAKAVASLEVMLDNAVFRLHKARGSVRAVHGVSVRGIVVKTEDVALEEWIERLCTSLAALSDSSAAARQAIGKIAGGAGSTT